MGCMTDTTAFPGSKRLRVDRNDYRPGSDGTGSVDVRLTHASRVSSGRGEGLATREGHMRMGADAALSAVSDAK